jgi:hypothetical protein
MKNLNKNIASKAVETLKDRTFQPSNQAWDRIDAMLTSSESIKPKKSFFWLKIAGSFIILGFVFALFNQEGEKQPIPNIVNIETNEKEILNPLDTNVKNIMLVKEELTVPILTKNEIVINTKPHAPSELNVNKVSNSQSQDTFQTPQLFVKNNPINVDAQKLLAEVENEMKNKSTLNQQNVAANTTKIKIDPTQLLDETEHEINQTFKNKAIDKVNKTFKDVKQALVKN